MKATKQAQDVEVERMVKLTKAQREARFLDESHRIARIRALGTVPMECGPDIIEAPARGPVVMFEPREVARTENGGRVISRTGHRGPGEVYRRKALRLGDAFEMMEAKAAATARRRGREGVALFTPAQVEAGRLYAALTERLAASGIKCASLEGGSGGGSGGTGVSEAQIDMIDRIRRFHLAVGKDWALRPQRAAPNRDRRRPIRDRDLVDMVCLQGRTLQAVLERHGWARSALHTKNLRSALCAALDRMYGL